VHGQCCIASWSVAGRLSRRGEANATSAQGFEKGEPDFPKPLSLEKAESVRETIRAFEASADSPEIISVTK